MEIQENVKDKIWLKRNGYKLLLPSGSGKYTKYLFDHHDIK